MQQKILSCKNISGAAVLVTGGAGFIGSNLVEALLACGCRVRVLDNFATGKMSNLAGVIGNRNFELIAGDIRAAETCRNAVKGVDYILHQAALGSVPRSIKDPLTSAEVNILGFINVLFAAQEAGVKRVVYASSSSVYGDSPILPKVEEKTGKPLSPYAISKAVDELYAENFHDLYGIDTIGMRYFNVFGRRQSPDGAYAAVIPRFASALIRHTSPQINGDGSFSRDFTYIDNVVYANLLALNSNNEAALNQVYNVACGKRLTLNELFDVLKKELSQFDREIAQIEPVYAPERQGDIPHSLAEIEKIRSLLGFEVLYDAPSGLHETAQWYFQNLS